MTHPALRAFSPATQAWFTATFGAPTPVQVQAWEAISRGEHTLVVAPTGSGKTLAAFLWALDRLVVEAPPPEALRRCRVVYVSPLKALALDVERNLRAPLAGIAQQAATAGLPPPQVQIDIRSGDTPAAARRRFNRHPGDVLITTPESLFLLLTSQARGALQGVQTVIVDEVHAVVASKRGTHLALSLERLEHLVGHPVQRVGLSATVRPTEEVATFLGGDRPVRVVAPGAEVNVDLSVLVPVPDMSTPDASGSGASIWPAVEDTLFELIVAHRSTIVFANSRRVAERLTARLNDLAALHDHPGPIAQAHHGSVSAAQRRQIEEDLKAGLLPAVVATSSLELGIDMGAVDLVVQVEAPPSVTSGLQRIGRAGHHVGAVSRGVILPKYRADLVAAAVCVPRMRAGLIEATRYPRNPLDVLAQQIVAMVAMENWAVDDLAQLVRRAAPYADLPHTAMEGVLDMLAGRYPAEEFATLRPRLVWDRAAGVLSARPGAARLAVTSGGTIPDRGLFGVFLASSTGGGPTGGRVGELDEEMVYESRVGDVFTLGTSSWRIEQITHDRVLVSPAPGRPGKVPFWHGDALGRPAELGQAVGRFLGELAHLDETAARVQARQAGLDEWAAGNVVAYLRAQQAATGHLPTDRTLVVERFRDELGDWRVVVHSPWGAAVHAPWALVVTARARRKYGVAVQAVYSDDGLVLRWPDRDAADEPAGPAAEGFGLADRPPEVADLLFANPEEVEGIVTAEAAGSALFAARFRECAARALLLPRRTPVRRAPLWQQRQRASALLDVAARYPQFPVVLETMREVISDVYDTAALVDLLHRVAERRVHVVQVDTQVASPFAKSLLFGYTAAFLYEGDAPLAERRAAALSLDTGMLAELLGRADLRELLDPQAIDEVEREVGWRTPERAIRDAEGVADLLRVGGPMTLEQVAVRVHRPGESDREAAAAGWLAELEQTRRILRVHVAGRTQWAAVEDAARLRDGLGVVLPDGVPAVFCTPVDDPVGDLLARHARTHGPFTAEAAAARFGLGVAVVVSALRRLEGEGRVVAGEFRPDRADDEWCDTDVLTRIRHRSLARARHEIEPVPAETLGRFLPVWAQVGAGRHDQPATPQVSSRLVEVIDQLAGAQVPASVLEPLVLATRVPGYTPAALDELTTAGEVVWAGRGRLGGKDGWVSLYPADRAPLLLPSPGETGVTGPVHETVLGVLAAGGGWFFPLLADQVRARLGAHEGPVEDQQIGEALWDLLWAGHVTNDSLAPLRARLTAPPRPRRPLSVVESVPTSTGGWPSPSPVGPTLPRSRWGTRSRLGRPRPPTRHRPPVLSGRWSLLPAVDPDVTRRAHALAETLLNRYGVLTRGVLTAEQTPGGFGGLYPVLSAMEEAGRVRRGYLVAGLGGAQFATSEAIDRLRAVAANATPGVSSRSSRIALAATDPANPYGAALPWPPAPPGAPRPARAAGALVVLVNGRLVWHLARGGRALTSWSTSEEDLQAAAIALTELLLVAPDTRVRVQRINGRPDLSSPSGLALQTVGFASTPGGLRWRG